jgi:hypothetical protein
MKFDDRVVSKFYRIKWTDQLKEMIRNTQITDLEENQIGNHVYSGKGYLQVGSQSHEVTIRVRISKGDVRFHLECPKENISINEPFNPKTNGKTVGERVRKILN